MHLLLIFLRWLLRLLRSRSRYGRQCILQRPIVRSNRKPLWVRHEVMRLKALMPEAGARSIAHLFNRRFAGTRNMTVGKSFVAVVVREEAYRIADLRRAIRRRQARGGRKNVVWGLDLTGKQSGDETINAILGILDHGTRKLLRLEVVPRLSAWTMLGHLLLAIGRYGKPKAVRTDNASIFTARIFRIVLAVIGVTHQRTEPGCPWQNGRIERLFGTLKQKLDCRQVATAHDLAGSLREFERWYNVVRPHQNLNGLTPDEAWHGIDPYRDRIRRTQWFSAWDGLLTGFIHRR